MKKFFLFSLMLLPPFCMNAQEREEINLFAVAEEVCDVVEEMPTYPGGQKALMQYIADSIKYPQKAKEEGIQGRVVVRFVVKKNGTVGEVQVLRGVSEELDMEAIRVIKSIKGFTPGKQNGKPVNVWFIYPVTFKIM